VKLSPENLEKIGLTIGNNSEGMKYISYWNTRMEDPIEFKVLVDWGIEMNPNEKMPNEMKNKTLLSPKMITDNSGNRRVEVFEAEDEVMTESISPTEIIETVDGNQKNIMVKQEKQLFMQKKENEHDYETVQTAFDSAMGGQQNNVTIRSQSTLFNQDGSDINLNIDSLVKEALENAGMGDKYTDEEFMQMMSKSHVNPNSNIIVISPEDTFDFDKEEFDFNWNNQNPKFKIRVKMDSTNNFDFDIDEMGEINVDQLKTDNMLFQMIQPNSDDEKYNKDILLKRLAQQNENSISFLDGFEKFDEKQMKSFFLEMESALENVSKYIFTDKARLDSLVNLGHFEGMELMLISSARLPIDTTSESLDSVLNVDMSKLAASYFNHNQNKFKIGGLPFGEIIQNSIVHHFKYIDVNQLIPIEVPIPGAKNKQGKELDDFSFIVWYEPTPELLELLPEDVAAQIEPELIALANAMGDGEEPEICEAAPVTGDDNYFDIWRSCSGNIRNLKVYPNPSSGPVNVEFELKEKTELFISVHTLNGRKIEELKGLQTYPAGKVSESFALGSDFEPGLYLVVIQASNGDQAVQRLILK
jgi:hypothetical protein